MALEFGIVLQSVGHWGRGDRVTWNGKGRSVTRGVSSLDFPEHLSARARATLARESVTRAVQEMIRRPCTVPGCRCRIHEILPAVEVMLELREDDKRNKQTKIGKEFGAPDNERLTWLPRDGGPAVGGATRIGEPVCIDSRTIEGDCAVLGWRLRESGLNTLSCGHWWEGARDGSHYH